jgi:hypothetical protein
MKVFEIYYDEEEGKCVTEANPFSFSEEIVIGVLSSVLYAFLSAVPEAEKEQFLASISEKFHEELMSGRILSTSTIE